MKESVEVTCQQVRTLLREMETTASARYSLRATAPRKGVTPGTLTLTSDREKVVISPTGTIRRRTLWR